MQARRDGTTIGACLDELARRFGLHATRHVSVEDANPKLVMRRLRERPPQRLAGRTVVQVEDLLNGERLPAADVIVLHTEDRSRVVVRPSGTEPKVKAYLQVVLDASRERAGGPPACDRADRRAGGRGERVDARVTHRPSTRSGVAAVIDHTLLHPAATPRDVSRLCAEARELGVFAVCVSPTMTRLAAAEFADTGIRVASVVGFPSGAHVCAVKALEAERALSDGAAELDMVINLALVRSDAWSQVAADIAAVCDAAPAATLKVILEAGVLDRRQLREACRAGEEAGAQFVKTSTGFRPSGGATVDDVRTMAEAVEGRLGVKASGGIRSADAALALIDAGADPPGAVGNPQRARRIACWLGRGARWCQLIPYQN